MTELKLLCVSADPTICTEGSLSLLRAKKYGELLEEVHMIVLIDGLAKTRERQISHNVWVYPVSRGFFSSAAAARRGKNIVFTRSFVRGRSLIIADDPLECAAIGRSISKRWNLPLEVECDLDLSKLNLRQAHEVGVALKDADAVSVADESLIGSLSERGIRAAHVLPPYIDQGVIEASKASFDLHAKYGWQFIMLAAAISRGGNKNFTMAVEVLSRLRKYFPDAGLVILGAGSEKKSIEAYARSHDARGGLAFADEKDWISCYRTADLFIQTSDFESYGEELAVAGLCGLPIVTTAVGMAKRLENGHDAIVCPIGDPEYMFRAVYDLVGNNGMRELLRGRAKTCIKRELAKGEAALASAPEEWGRIASKVSPII